MEYLALPLKGTTGCRGVKGLLAVTASHNAIGMSETPLASMATGHADDQPLLDECG
jgi:hypothetical protein